MDKITEILKKQISWIIEIISKHNFDIEDYINYDSYHNDKYACKRCKYANKSCNHDDYCKLTWDELSKIHVYKGFDEFINEDDPIILFERLHWLCNVLKDSSECSLCDYCPANIGLYYDYSDNCTWCRFQDYDSYDCPFTWLDASRVAINGYYEGERKNIK